MYFKKIDKQIVDDLAISSLEKTLYCFKPGLTNGADEQSLEYKKAIQVLKGAFASSFEHGGEYSCVESGYCFDMLRLKLKVVENKMLDVTDGKRTHVGALFAMSLMACAAGRLDALGLKFEPQYLMTSVADFARNCAFRAFVNLPTKSTELTDGEKFYLKTGDTSLRGAAEEGFETVLTKSLDFLDNCVDDIETMHTRLYLLLASILKDSGIMISHGEHVMSDITCKSKQLFDNFDLDMAKEFDLFLKEKSIQPKAAMTMHSLALFTQKIMKLQNRS